MANITKLAEGYIREHPSVKDCLKNGILNYSSLSRQISSELGLNLKKNFDAILIACRRFERKLKNEAIEENKILKILKESKIEVKNKIVAIVVEKDVYYETLLNLEKEIKKRRRFSELSRGYQQ